MSPRDAGGARRRPAWPLRRRGPGIALDLGSARTRVWTTGRGDILDVPTVVGRGAGTGHPVRRGTIVDSEGVARLLSRLVAERVPRNARPVVVFTTPVLSDPGHQAAAADALRALRPRTVLAIDGVKAIALAAGADLSRPLLVVDLGAHLTEVALLADGAVAVARRSATPADGTAGARPTERAAGIAALITGMFSDDPRPQMVDALDRGLLLAGGGALRPKLAHLLCARLRVPVQAVPQPQTAAVRGAARALDAARRHPGLGTPVDTPPPA
ncbi:rod shape-determining protein [Streptomyces johnsoniae]|uniref:Rod shape-determining protein n=1 Tax=Streptomyces johnsoniae TaxID=3075532 RepID=A0ABU2RXA6_9ACTN|nr:rod shape-determining protein [Streptomyces sp. DSM 41886]MDT0441383.1 rod shape-determining protein [Streptomyces sp. DSM 41886]